MPLSRSGKIALGAVGGAAVLTAIGVVVYRVAKSGTPSPNPTGGGSPAIQLGQPTLTGAVGLHRVFAARRGVRRAALNGVFVNAVGSNNFAAMSGSQGQALTLPLTLANGTGGALYFAPTIAIYEVGQVPPAGAVMVNVGGTQYPVGGHMGDPGGNLAPRSAVPAGQSATIDFHSSALSWTATTDGLYVSVAVFTDAGYSVPLAGSPLIAWTNAFLTIQPPSAGSAVTVTLGSPSVA